MLGLRRKQAGSAAVFRHAGAAAAAFAQSQRYPGFEEAWAVAPDDGTRDARRAFIFGRLPN
jgi:hypothetical protein